VTALLERLQADGEGARPAPLLVHYANYGYARRGCPGWLVEGVEGWRAAGGRRLVTLFHEVYATGPPWRSSFWLTPRQRRLARRLADASDAVVTTLPVYAELLAGCGHRGSVEVLPVFSTVGEPAVVTPLAERLPRLVVFGGRGVRSRAYGGQLAALEASCRALDIEEVVDVGPSSATLPATVAGRPVTALGMLPAGEVSRHLAAARVGFLAYPPAFLPKSTIFAAYCAHGLLPVCAWSRPQRGAVAAGRHFWAPGCPAQPTDLAALAVNAKNWYNKHSLSFSSRFIADLLREPRGPG
jgi:hypothetical protein